MAPYTLLLFVLAPFVGGARVSQSQDLQSSAGSTRRRPASSGGLKIESFTSLEPDPTKLVWTSASSSSNIRLGWLKVPVVHDTTLSVMDESPHACLRVRMLPATKQPAKQGPILYHPGGPGTDASYLEDAVFQVPLEIREEYDFWSISQRSMDQQESDDEGCPFEDKDGTSLEAWPEPGTCDSIAGLYANDPKEVWKRTVGTDFPDGWEAILEKALFSNYLPPILDEDTAMWYYRLHALALNLCSTDERFQWKWPGSRQSLNILQYSSTSDLARDIEVFRTAIGARSMSIYGISYGTKVGSVYATTFPDKVGKLILDSGMGVDPDTEVFMNWVGESLEAVWAGVATACDNSVMAHGGSSCPAAPRATSKLLKFLTGADKSVARAVFQTAYSRLIQSDVPRAYQLLQCLADLDNGQNSRFCPTSDPPRKSMFVVNFRVTRVAAVLGADLAGRLTEEAFLRWYREMRVKQPLGIQRTFLFAGAVATWPFVPRPQPPAGDSTVAPLIIGNLFDAATPYRNAQRLGDTFPSGRVLTTQFYGHGLASRRDDNTPLGKAKLLCDELTHTYLNTGALPRDAVCTAPPFLQLTPPFGAPSVRSFAKFSENDPFPSAESYQSLGEKTQRGRRSRKEQGVSREGHGEGPASSREPRQRERRERNPRKEGHQKKDGEPRRRRHRSRRTHA